jgi:hypothetical protein
MYFGEVTNIFGNLIVDVFFKEVNLKYKQRLIVGNTILEVIIDTEPNTFRCLVVKEGISIKVGDKVSLSNIFIDNEKIRKIPKENRVFYNILKYNPILNYN